VYRKEPLPPFLQKLIGVGYRIVAGAALGFVCTIAILVARAVIWGDLFGPVDDNILGGGLFARRVLRSDLLSAGVADASRKRKPVQRHDRRVSWYHRLRGRRISLRWAGHHCHRGIRGVLGDVRGDLSAPPSRSKPRGLRLLFPLIAIN
jgi:hypothetical protein